MSEPAAAALAHYGSKMADHTGEVILVFDLGGGTFDVTVAEIEGPESMRVIGNAGDFFGGEHLDDELVLLIAKKGEQDVKKMPDSLKVSLRGKCKEIKEAFASPSIKNQSINFTLTESVEITRAEFDKLAKEFVKKCIPPVDKV